MAHVNNINRKVNHSFQPFKSLHFFLPIRTKITLAHTLILPAIDYGDACFLDAMKEVAKQIIGLILLQTQVTSINS